MAENKTLDYALRALQLIFAVIVMGTDGYAIHKFHRHTVYVHFEFGNYYDHVTAPDAWGFLMFCAGWTVLAIFFHLLVARTSFVGCAWMGYIRVAVEAVAVLSWLAGFIATAIQIPTGTCSSEGKGACALLEAATVFGACEWLVFMVTAALTAKVVFTSRKPKTSTTKSETAV